MNKKKLFLTAGAMLAAGSIATGVAMLGGGSLLTIAGEGSYTCGSITFGEVAPGNTITYLTKNHLQAVSTVEITDFSTKDRIYWNEASALKLASNNATGSITMTFAQTILRTDIYMQAYGRKKPIAVINGQSKELTTKASSSAFDGEWLKYSFENINSNQLIIAAKTQEPFGVSKIVLRLAN